MWGKHGDIALLNPQRAATQFLESAYQLTQYITFFLSVCLIVFVLVFCCCCFVFFLIDFFRISPTNYSKVDRELIDSLSVL